LGDFEFGAIGFSEEFAEAIGFGVVEECPRGDEVNALFKEESFDFGMLANLANGPIGETATFGIEGVENLETDGAIGGGIGFTVVI